MKILVVEDNEKLRKLLAHLLEKEGYAVIQATGGADGLAKYGEHKPDIVCLDVMMEDASGFDVCRKLRAADPQLTILMITSKSRDVDIAEGKAAGANDYIVKPFDLSDITARVREIVRARIAQKDPALSGRNFELGNVRVFPGQLRAERDGETLDLNMRDVRILQLFHDSRGQTVGVAALKDHCWMMQSPDEAKAVEWNINHLRKKIEGDPANPVLIASVEGGYRHG